MLAREYITLVRNNPIHQIIADDCLRCNVVDNQGKKTKPVRIAPERLIETPVAPTIDPDGTLRYTQKGWEPPPSSILHTQAVLEGREWVLTLKNPKCRHLEMFVGKAGSCGCSHIITKCALGKGPCPCPDHIE